MHHPIQASTSLPKTIHTPAISDCGAFAAVARASAGSERGPASVSAVHKKTTLSDGAVSRPGTRSKFIKVRVAPDEYLSIARQADIASQPMSEYVREQVLAVHRTLNLQAELVALRGLVSAPARATDDTLALEAVLLLRELAAARDAQILGRVRAQMAQRSGRQA